MQDCWKRADTLPAFQHALQERGFFLAKGDKRGFVVLDHAGEVWSLPRMLDLKTKEVRARLGEGERLPSVATTQKIIGERMTPAIRRHIAESREQFRGHAAKLGERKEEMTRLHRAERVTLDTRQKTEWDAETRDRAARLPTGLRGLWHRITGKYQNIRRLNETEADRSRDRQASERQHLIDRQREQRAALQMQFKDLRRKQAQQLLNLRADIGRFLKLKQNQQPAPTFGPARGTGLKLDR